MAKKRSRININYVTKVDGKLREQELPLQLGVVGDFSGKAPSEKENLHKRRSYTLDKKNTKLDTAMKEMNIHLSLKIENKIDGKDGEKMDVNLPIEKMRSFHPDEIAKNVPKIKKLLLLKSLLTEIKNKMRNKEELKEALNEIYSNKEEYEQLKEELAKYKNYSLNL